MASIVRTSLRCACVLLVLLAGCATRPPAASHNTVLLVSIDGLRADQVGSGAMPTLDALARDGVHARWMNPSYPSQTFPNHYTLVTGLRPDHHGIIDNDMHDPALGDFAASNRAAVQDARWWGGEPIWVTLQKHGGHAATMYWPGSEAAVAGRYPDDWLPFDAKVTPTQRVDQVLAWLDRPPTRRPGLITLYFNRVDRAGHDHGPDSPAYADAMQLVDAALARLLAGLDARGLRDRIDLVVVSDHGMASIAPGHRLYMDDALAAAGLTVDAIADMRLGQFAVITPRPAREAEVTAALVGPHPHYTCWRKQDLPVRWQYGSHPRILPLVCQVDVGWQLRRRSGRESPDIPRGGHGYAPEAPQMRAVFVANGPDFVSGATLAPFDNVDVYPLLARLLGVPARPNDGDAATWEAALKPTDPGIGP